MVIDKVVLIYFSPTGGTLLRQAVEIPQVDDEPFALGQARKRFSERQAL